ncbi:MAG: hypothetical protein N2544_17850, partial [Burkholderiales bacterium]|nr:hypothetical protein [Burkholderiales bacterium]
GSVTLIGTVSPPGGDFSEPVTRHTKEIVQTFWALSRELADARHYPAVDWVESFCGDVTAAARWWTTNVDAGWQAARAEALALLAASAELTRIVNLVGVEALSAEQRWTLEAAALIKEGVLQQSALDPVDSHAAPPKQYLLLRAMLDIHAQGMRALGLGVPVRRLLELPLLVEARRWKGHYGSEEVEALRARVASIPQVFEALVRTHQAPDARG